jgi:hypothetical protein
MEDSDESIARCALEEEGGGAAAASFDGKGGTRQTTVEELRLSKGDGCDTWLGSRRRPSVGAHAGVSLVEAAAQLAQR